MAGSATGARRPTSRARQLTGEYAQSNRYAQGNDYAQSNQDSQANRYTQSNRNGQTGRRSRAADRSTLAQDDRQSGRRGEPLAGRAAPTRGSSNRRRDPLSATASRASTGRATGNTAGSRKKPGGHRRVESARAFPKIPALAGVATLVVAASGALTVHSGLISVTGSGHDVPPAGMALTAGQLQEARAAAAERANRSRRDAVAAATATQERAAARERAAWEQQHSKEIQAAERKAAGATDQQVFARVIKWVLPVRSFRLTAGFGQAGGMWVADHTGQDFAAPMGTPIRAVGDGEIISAAYDGPYGNRIVIRHTDGTETWYCHMSGYAHRSGWVRAGETIGYLGATGNTTGPHLHFEVHPNGGDAIDPLPWLRRLGLPI
ncbi:MAG TPA: M23 family metallopeptidase [Actinopolymorphaceae bacterium]|nr:M23 family metallopeptidase [Actinopolymorphaceae bacterium]